MDHIVSQDGARANSTKRGRSHHTTVLHGSAVLVASRDMDGARLWYFAYGSNLCRDIFIDRRGMRPMEVRVGRLDGYRLCFDLPIGSGERAVANLIADPAAHVWGALYHLTAAQCEHLDRTEGVPNGIYCRREVSVTDGGGMSVAAFTYESSRRVTARKPSPRYMNLLLAGAREHGLPDPYLTFLRSFALAIDEREEALGQLSLFPRK
jgi:cation transport regulator ChaC